MKICPKCNNIHENKGKFCCRGCANSRSFSEETKKLKSLQNKKYYISLSEEEKEERKEFLKNNLNKYGENANKRASRIFLLEADTKDLKLSSIRKKVNLEQNNKCLICNIFEWNNKPITLQLDHIDGNKYNNERNNLRMICPNCHSQTDTFVGRNKKYKV